MAERLDAAMIVRDIVIVMLWLSSHSPGRHEALLLLSGIIKSGKRRGIRVESWINWNLGP